MGLLYPVGQQNFEKIRNDGKVYVDKTALIYNLTHSVDYVFLSRPRRFGKSLLLSTMKAYFEGKKELFQGLAIEHLEKDWIKYPVISLELSRIDSFDENSLNDILDEQFKSFERQFGIDKIYPSFSSRFTEIIKSAFNQTGLKVVVLIDEYDNPLINTLNRPEIHERNKELLKSVYSNLKSMDEYIKFGFLTGVTRFSKAGIFSGLNNLTDITFEKKYSTICGFTEKEIRDYLWEGVKILGQEEGMNTENALHLLKQEYDGYHFSEDLTDIYNPYSLLRALHSSKIENYWIDSGTPSFLIERLKETEEPFFELFNEEGDTSTLAAIDTAFTSPVALMYQTGYLTIKDYDRKERVYKLGIPNKEVREGFFSVVLSEFVQKDRMKGIKATKRMKACLEEGNAQEFLERVQSFLAGVSYELTSKAPEIYFENNLYVMLQMMGLDVKAEDETSNGRIDLSVKTDKYIYIIEIKKDTPPEKALEQIERKEYALKYRFDDRKIITIGICFSSQTRNISSWLIK